MSKTLIKNKEEFGYLPWSSRSLGCIRWTRLPNFDTDEGPGVVLDSPKPEIQFVSGIEIRSGDTVSLPENSRSTRFSKPQKIVWSLGPSKTTCEIKQNQLIVRGSEDDEIVLKATINGVEINQFSVVIMDKISTPLLNRGIGITQEIANNPMAITIRSKSKLKGEAGLPLPPIAKCEFRINNSPWRKATSHKSYRSSGQLDCTIKADISEIPVSDLPTLRVRFTTMIGTAYEVQAKFDISDKLRLNLLRPDIRFVPETLDLEDVLLQQDSSESCVELRFAVTGNEVDAKFLFESPAQKIEWSIPSGELPSRYSHGVKRSLVAKWLNITDYNDITIKFTPMIGENLLHILASSATLNIRKEEEPMIGGNDTKLIQSWVNFLSLSPSQIEQIATSNNIPNPGGALEDILENEDGIIKKRFRRRQVFRAIRQPSEVDPLIINDNTKKILEVVFEISKKAPLLVKMRSQSGDVKDKPTGMTAKEFMDSYYQGGSYPASRLYFDPQEGRLLSLGPRQSFRLAGVLVRDMESLKFHSIEPNYQLNNAPVLLDRGNELVFNHNHLLKNNETLKSGIGFRESNGDFTAPETPGLYLLTVASYPPIEMEVLGSKEGELPFQ